MRINIKESSIIIIEYIISILIVLNCNSVFSNLVYKEYKFSEWIVILTFLLLCFLLIQDKLNSQFNGKLILFVLIFWIYLFVFILFSVSSNRLLEFVAKFVIFIPIMTVCFYLYGKKGILFRMFYRIADIVIIIACISLTFWLLGSILGILQPTGKVLYRWLNDVYINSYFNIYFETQKISFMGFSGVRNTAIFTEAPMFSLILSISLLIEICMKSEINKKRVVILLLAQLTTVSTTGWCFSIAIVIFKFMFTRSNKEHWYFKLLKWALLTVCIIVAVSVVNIVILEKSESSSYSIRMDDYIAGFKAWMDYPILGNGFGANSAITYYMSSFRRDNLGFSNSIMNVLAQGGLYLFAVYIFPFILYFREYFQKNNINLFLIGIGLMILFISTIFNGTFIMLLFLSLGYSLIFIEEYKKLDNWLIELIRT